MFTTKRTPCPHLAALRIADNLFGQAICKPSAMQILLRDTIHPTWYKPLKELPHLFMADLANIAQGTNTAIAIRMALKLSDYVVTEAGFATDWR